MQVFRARDLRDAPRFASPRSFARVAGLQTRLIDLSVSGCAIAPQDVELDGDKPLDALLVLVWDDEQMELPLKLLPVRQTDERVGFRLEFPREEFKTILSNYLEDVAGESNPVD